MDALAVSESSIEPVQLELDAGQAYERGKSDFNFFAGLAMPTVSVYQLPLFYIAIWQILTSRNEVNYGKLLRFALGLPRGHAKTTFIKILVAWMIVYDKISFILIVCSNADLAENLLADLHDILRSPNMTKVYGDWEAGLSIDAAETKKAVYHRRSVSIVARGWAAGVRGLNLQNERPDVIICDDVQTRKNDESESERLGLLKELTGTIFKAIAPRGNRLIVYIGNMYSEDCILNKFKESPYWISMVTGAILENGEPLWPELFSLEELMEGYYHDEHLGLADIWFAEIMNDPKNAALTLLPHPIPDSKDDLTDDEGAFITIDPAGFRVYSDDNVIIGWKKKNDKGYAVEHNKDLKDPMEIILETLRMAERLGVTLIGIEAVAYQQTLCFWMTHFIKQFGLTHITVVELQPHGRKKESRIRSFITSLYNKTFYLHSPALRRDFVWQATVYKLGKPKNRDDLLDSAAYAEDIRNEYWDKIQPLKARVYMGECRVIADNVGF